MSDTRYCYGSNCTWFGPIKEVGARDGGRHAIAALPCCPYCKGMLFEMATEAEWWAGVDAFERAGHAGYRKMLEWQRAQKVCFNYRLGGIDNLVAAYKAATGIRVNIA